LVRLNLVLLIKSRFLLFRSLVHSVLFCVHYSRLNFPTVVEARRHWTWPVNADIYFTIKNHLSRKAWSTYACIYCIAIARGMAMTTTTTPGNFFSASTSAPYSTCKCMSSSWVHSWVLWSSRSQSLYRACSRTRSSITSFFLSAKSLSIKWKWSHAILSYRKWHSKHKGYKLLT